MMPVGPVAASGMMLKRWRIRPRRHAPYLREPLIDWFRVAPAGCLGVEK